MITTIKGAKQNHLCVVKRGRGAGNTPEQGRRLDYMGLNGLDFFPQYFPNVLA